MKQNLSRILKFLVAASLLAVAGSFVFNYLISRDRFVADVVDFAISEHVKENIGTDPNKIAAKVTQRTRTSDGAGSVTATYTVVLGVEGVRYTYRVDVAHKEDEIRLGLRGDPQAK